MFKDGRLASNLAVHLASVNAAGNVPSVTQISYLLQWLNSLGVFSHLYAGVTNTFLKMVMCC